MAEHSLHLLGRSGMQALGATGEDPGARNPLLGDILVVVAQVCLPLWLESSLRQAAFEFVNYLRKLVSRSRPCQSAWREVLFADTDAAARLCLEQQCRTAASLRAIQAASIGCCLLGVEPHTSLQSTVS